MKAIVNAVTKSAQETRNGGTTVSIIFTVAVVVAAALLAPRVVSQENLGNLLTQIVPLLSVSIGQTIVVLTGGIDLSVGPVISLTTAIVSTSLHPLLAVTVAFLAGIAIGIVNGIGVTSLRIHPIVMTLVSGIFVQAIALIVRGVPGGTVSASIKWLNSGNAAGIPAPIFAILGLILVAYIVLYVSPLGIHIFAVGANRQYADLNGVKTYRVLTKTYVLSSCFAVFAGLVVAARIGSGFAYAGESFTLDSITAVALGGTSIVGGAGSLWGTVSAIITLSVLGNGMNLANLSAYIQQLVKGLILLVVISLQGRERFGL